MFANKINRSLLAIATVTVALAGCIEDDPAPVAGTNGKPVELGNLGAINGLVVDDNYRPVQLKEEWGNSGPGEFQDLGFVLILETGQRFPTTENGEFQVLPLEPGTYTIRVAADNHEAKESTVEVVSGEYTEVTLQARRTFSDGGTLLSQEEVLFMACYGNFYFFSMALAAVEVPGAGIPNGCGDLSGDSSRFDFWTDQPELTPILRGLVTEMRADKNWDYRITMRIVESDGEGGELPDGSPACNPYCDYGSASVKDGIYIHNVLYPGLQFMGNGEYLEDGEAGYCKIGREPSTCEVYAFTPEWNFQTALFTGHPTSEYTEPTCAPTEEIRDIKEENVGGYPPTGCGGAGLAFGVKAQFLQNMFLYELPEDGIESYCSLCDDADIPE